MCARKITVPSRSVARTAKSTAKRSVKVVPTVPSTPTTIDVEVVETLEGHPKKPDYCWTMEIGLDRNFHAVGKLLASLGLPLYRHREGGLLLVEDGQARHITSAKELAPMLIDNIRIAVVKNGKYQGEKPSESVLTNMLMSRSFLASFELVEDVVTTPIVLHDSTPSTPGYNPQGRILYLGPAVGQSGQDGSSQSKSKAQGGAKSSFAAKRRRTSTPQAQAQRFSLRWTNHFLDVMEWQSNSDRTNTVAALLTVPFRHHFPGGKPLGLVTSTKSQSGKGTLIEFIRGKTAKAAIEYEDKDWPMHRSLHDQLAQKPDIGIIDFDNVRTDTNRSKVIRSGFLESFITNSEIILSSTRNKTLRVANRFFVLLNTNEGSLSIDLLNRSLPIRLNPIGDLTDRISRAKAKLGGDVKHDWLPAHRHQVEVELWGMIERWRSEGKPLDNQVRHPMGPWAQTIGGVLIVNGFTDFLANYSVTRSAADPLREALSILAFFAGAGPKRAADMAKIAVTQGLAKTLLPNADPNNEAACQRVIGVTLTPYVGETFSARTASEKITYRLKKPQGRFGEAKPHFRYLFEEVGREAVKDDSPNGLVLEEPSQVSSYPAIYGLDEYKPEVI